MGERKKCLYIVFSANEFVEKMRFFLWSFYTTSNKLLLVARHSLSEYRAWIEGRSSVSEYRRIWVKKQGGVCGCRGWMPSCRTSSRSCRMATCPCLCTPVFTSRNTSPP